MINDTVGDFLTRVRNAVARQKETVEVPSSNMIEAIVKILKEENFITDFKIEKNDIQNRVIVELKYVDEQPAIQDLKRVSKPGVRKYRGYRDIKPVRNGLGISIFSTPKGVITGEEAAKQKVGGEYICEIY